MEGAYAALANYAANLPAHAVLLRLGFGSGRDALTVNYAQPDPLVSTSRFLVDDVWPLGWLEMRVFTLDGKPFSPEADLKWQADPLPMAIAPSKTAARKANKAPAQSPQVETERSEKARLESTSQTASDVLAFLQKKRAKGDGS